MRPGEDDRTLVDLVKRIRRHDSGALARTIDDRLGKREQGFAAAIDRQYLPGRIDPGDLVTALDPAGNGVAQRFASSRGRITGQSADLVDQLIADELRCRVFRFTDRQADRTQRGVRGDTCKQCRQLLERVRLQSREIGIHYRCIELLRPDRAVEL